MLNSSAIQEAKDLLLPQIGAKPTTGLILGSGLGVLADEIRNPVIIPYKDIPHFPVSTVQGHSGRLVVGDLEGVRVVVMQGRSHAYEGYSLDQITLPVRVMKSIGAERIIITNAAGALHTGLRPGQLMLIRDHINLAFRHPLIGPNDHDFGPRFPDMSEAYSRKWLAVARRTAVEQNIDIVEGTYAWLLGPSYETPAEIKMLQRLGSDAVGMSTVPECIVARHTGMEVLGISCISNMAAGILNQPLSHDEVMETAERVRPIFIRYVKSIIANTK